MDADQLGNWLAARCGKLTASRMGDALDFRKDGKAGANRVRLMKDLLAERVTQLSIRHYVNPAMEWGALTEPEAKSAYEAETGLFIAEAGFYDHPRIDLFGATPDGLLPGNGLIETKCPTTATFVEWCMASVVPEEYKPQMLAQMACTGRRWCEFVAFDPRIKNPKRRLFIRRYEPKPEEIAAIETAAETFLAELEAAFEAFTEAAA